MATSEVIERVYVNDRKEFYKPLIPSEWVREQLATAETAPTLETVFDDFMVSWRSTSMTAAMPSAIVDMVTAFADGFANSRTPEGSILNFGKRAIQMLTLSVPELTVDTELQSKLQHKLTELLFQLQTADNQEIKCDPQWLWKHFFTVPQFQLTLWASQRIAYVAFYNAYEDFLVRLVKTAAGVDSLRTSDKKNFNKHLRESFGEKGRDFCWTNDAFNTIRLVRHSLVHAGGRITEDLRGKKHNVEIVNDKLQISAIDNRDLVEDLQDRVKYLVDQSAAMERFQ